MGDTLRTAIVVDALNMAVWNRRPAAEVVHHSDRAVMRYLSPAEFERRWWRHQETVQDAVSTEMVAAAGAQRGPS